MNDSFYYVYVIESISSGIWYVGLSQNPEERLKQHNRGKSKFTQGYLPWRKIYSELAGDLKSARKLEKYYKTTAGKNRLRKILGI